MDFPQAKQWLIALFTIFAIAVPARAETFPNRTIRIIVPYAAGGSIDLTAQGTIMRIVLFGNFPE